MSLSRRDLLRRAAALGTWAAIPSLTACGDSGTPDDGLPRYEYDGPPGPETLFQHGVASGDPLPDAVILWTRASPGSTGDVDVFLEVARDPDFDHRVAAGTFTACAERDHTLKVDADGLEPGTTYYYRFRAMDRTTATGRTRTAAQGAVEHLRFGVYACASLAHGWLHALAKLAARPDLSAILCVGDYIYEYGNGPDGFGAVREYEPPHEIRTLSDYRTRYAQYRREAELQEAHRQHPFIAVWDDHEIVNNAWSGGAPSHVEAEHGPFADRKAAAQRAYDEWMPLRTTSPEQIFRKLSFGDLFDLFMLDTRAFGRDQDDAALQDDESRTLLGFAQEAWLEDGLSSSTSTWRILGNQVLMSQWGLGPDTFLNPGSWDGYRAARNRLFGHLRKNDIGNVIVLTGDIHSSWVNELTEYPLDPQLYDPATGAGAVAVEFVMPGVLSETPPISVDSIRAGNPQTRWAEGDHRGYLLVDITRERVHVDYFYLDDAVIESPAGGDEIHGAAWVVDAGTPRPVLGDGPAPEIADPPDPAPG